MNLKRLNNFLNVAELNPNLSEGKDHVLFVYEESLMDVWYMGVPQLMFMG